MSPQDPSDGRSDRDLVKVCNDGGGREAQAAFDVLYKRHKDFVLRIARRYVPDNDAALDVVQETFSYLLRKFPPPGPGLTLTASLSTLLYPVARNNAISWLRKAQRFPVATAIEPDDLQAPDAPVQTELQPLLADLSPERQEVILLRFVDDLSLDEIATALDVPLGTVKSRLHLAIKQLRASPLTKKFFDS